MPDPTHAKLLEACREAARNFRELEKRAQSRLPGGASMTVPESKLAQHFARAIQPVLDQAVAEATRPLVEALRHALLSTPGWVDMARNALLAQHQPDEPKPHNPEVCVDVQEYCERLEERVEYLRWALLQASLWLEEHTLDRDSDPRLISMDEHVVEALKYDRDVLAKPDEPSTDAE